MSGRGTKQLSKPFVGDEQRHPPVAVGVQNDR
jgi:hypothetical protein